MGWIKKSASVAPQQSHPRWREQVYLLALCVWLCTKSYFDFSIIVDLNSIHTAPADGNRLHCVLSIGVLTLSVLASVRPCFCQLNMLNGNLNVWGVTCCNQVTVCRRSVNWPIGRILYLIFYFHLSRPSLKRQHKSESIVVGCYN